MPLPVRQHWQGGYSRIATQKHIHIVAYFRWKGMEIMTEYNLFIQCVPMIAEMVFRAKRMTEDQYREWRQEYENVLEVSGQERKGFAWKVLEVVDIYRGREIIA